MSIKNMVFLFFLLFHTFISSEAENWTEILPASPTRIFDKEEIVWFGVSDKLIAFCNQQGHIFSIDIENGRTISSLKLKNYSTETTKLFLSNGKNPKIGLLEEEQEGPILSILDIMTEKKEQSSGGKRFSYSVGYGFDDTGNLFFCFSIDDNKIHRISLSGGAFINEFAYENQVGGSTEIFCNGKRSVSFSSDMTVMQDEENNVIWKQELDSDNSMEPADVNQPWNSLLVIFESNLVNEKGSFLAIDKYGKIVWEKDGDWNSLIAVTADGKKQLFRSDKKTVLTSLPDKKETILKTEDEIEAYFTPDGKHLVVLPSFEPIKDDREKNTIELKRDNHIIRVFNAKNGKELYSRDLDVRNN
jgi:hypothetical protein